jgi:hypothetical protein
VTTGGTPTTDIGTSTTSTTSDASESGSSEGGSGTGAPVCSLEQVACDLAESNGEFEDCGSVDPWDDDTAAWQAAHDCAVAAASEQRAFKVVTWLQGIDSQIGVAYASLVGRSYGLSHFGFDSDPCGGGGCGPVVYGGSCDLLVATPDCMVEPGQACLTCVNQGDSTQFCGPE